MYVDVGEPVPDVAGIDVHLFRFGEIGADGGNRTPTDFNPQHP